MFFLSVELYRNSAGTWAIVEVRLAVERLGLCVHLRSIYVSSLTDWLFSETIFSIYLHVYLPSGEGVEIPGEKHKQVKDQKITDCYYIHMFCK